MRPQDRNTFNPSHLSINLHPGFGFPPAQSCGCNHLNGGGEKYVYNKYILTERERILGVLSSHTKPRDGAVLPWTLLDIVENRFSDL